MSCGATGGRTRMPSIPASVCSRSSSRGTSVEQIATASEEVKIPIGGGNPFPGRAGAKTFRGQPCLRVLPPFLQRSFPALGPDSAARQIVPYFHMRYSVFGEERAHRRDVSHAPSRLAKTLRRGGLEGWNGFRLQFSRNPVNAPQAAIRSARVIAAGLIPETKTFIKPHAGEAGRGS